MTRTATHRKPNVIRHAPLCSEPDPQLLANPFADYLPQTAGSSAMQPSYRASRHARHVMQLVISHAQTVKARVEHHATLVNSNAATGQDKAGRWGAAKVEIKLI